MAEEVFQEVALRVGALRVEERQAEPSREGEGVAVT